MSGDKRLDRRQFLRILAAGTAGALVFKGGWDVLTTGPKKVSETWLLMGTVVYVTIVADEPGVAQAAARACWSRMSTLEAMLSRFHPRSEVSQLNSAGRLEQPSEPLLTLLEESHTISSGSNGAFDITIAPLVELYQAQAARGLLPSADAVRERLRLVDYRRIARDSNSVVLTRSGMRITLDAIAKGYIVDAGVAELRAHGMTNVLVEAGGDLMASGHKAPSTPWEVGIEAPRGARDGFMATCGLVDRAMCTSGDYQQYYSADHREFHVLDPRRGHSPRQLASVSVTAPTAMLADALATTCMVLGPQESLQLLERLPGCEAFMVAKDLRTITSSGFGS